MKKFTVLALVGLFLFSCGSKKNETPLVLKLSDSELFDFDKVSSFTASATPESIQAAKQSFLKAIDEYRNKKSPQTAIPLFTESLLSFPQAKTYYEYGNALLDLKDYPKAISAFHMAEKLDYSPLSKLLYNLACAYSLSENEDESLRYMELAIQNGYTNGSHILKDPDMEFARNSTRFNSVYENAMSGAMSPEKALFDLYLNEFPEVDFTYTLTAQKSQKIPLESAIGYDYEKFVPNMRDERFSRDVGNEFYFVAKFPTTTDFKLVLYSEKGVWMENSPTSFVLHSYTSEGETIDMMEVAGYTSFDEMLKEFSIHQNLQFEVKEFETVWKSDPDKAGYEENSIVKYTKHSTQQYRIDAVGKFVSSKPMLGMLKRSF